MPPAESVKVIVRCRPLNRREKDLTCKIVVSMDPAKGQCALLNPAEPSAPAKMFTFDGVYFMDSTAEQIYNDIVYPLVENVLEGYNGTVFAYGQTGSGKTFSMQGTCDVAAQRGIIPRTFEHIFEATATTENTKFLVHGSYLEIYNEEVKDLLGTNTNQKLDIKEHPDKGVYVAGLSMHAMHNVQECEELMSRGFSNRHVGATLMNADSSRSHSIFTVHLEMMDLLAEEEHIRIGKLHLVDLAGSERQAKTGATGARFKEATKINLSLSALGNVISALIDGKSKHIPYRDSKLTRLLQDSLGGNTKTLMVACMSPADNNYDETLSTLRYANRAKNIKNKPKINEDPKDALLKEYQEEINRLKEMLQNGGAAPTLKRQPSIDHDAEKEKLRAEFEAQMNELKMQYQAEQKSNAKLQEDLKHIKQNYEKQKTKLDTVIEVEEAEMQKQAEITAPTCSPTIGAPAALDTGEAMKRLELLQQQMVGGEQTGNTALKEKRQRKKKEAEKRMEKLADALSKVKSDDPMLHVYNTVQDKLDAVTRELDKEKKTVKLLENEIRDLQSEFELDRQEYLDTIRLQDQQLRLLQQIVEKVQPCLRRDSNYANIEKIKKEAVWDQDMQRWILPEVQVNRTQLPTAGAGGIMPGGRMPMSNALTPRQLNGYSGLFDEPDDDKLKMRLEQSETENMANNYFKPLRSSGLFTNKETSNNKAAKPQSHFPNTRNTWDNLMNGVLYTNDIYERSCSGSPQRSVSPIRKPQRLEALGNVGAVTPKKSRKKYG